MPVPSETVPVGSQAPDFTLTSIQGQEGKRSVRPHYTPSPCLADSDRLAYRQSDVKSAMVSLGQRPGLFIVDREGVVRYAYLGWQQWEIPSVEETLRELDALGWGPEGGN